MFLFGKDLICTESWKDSELLELILLAKEMKSDPYHIRWNNSLKNKKFLMLFYNPSLRTHLSFESAVVDLGGHPIYRTPEMGWIKSKGKVGSEEALKDIAKVASCYMDGIGIRVSMNAISQYGDGYRFLSDFAKFSDVPVISMAGDRFHPCQGLSDLLGWAERYSVEPGIVDMNSLKGKTLLLTWGSSGFARPWASVQSHLLLAARFGMNIRLAYPKSGGYDLDPEVTERAQYYCRKNNTQYKVINDPDAGYEETNVVYVRNWVSNHAYQHGCFQYESEIKQAFDLKQWIVTKEKMRKTQNALFANPMPVDRGREAEDVVVDSKNSVIYEVADNRRHIQKALLLTVMGTQ